jgi:hypothetical protein
LSTATRPSPARGLWAVPIVLAVVLVVAVGVRPGEVLCQPGQLLPKGSGRMRMFVAPAKQGGRAETLVTIKQAQDGVIARTAGHYRSPGVLDVKIDPPVKRTRVDATVCIKNTGSGTIVMSGILTPFGNVQLRGKKLDVSLTMLWYTPDSESWLSNLGAIIPRVGHARLGGVWAFWAAGLLVLAAIALALTTAIRENTR